MSVGRDPLGRFLERLKAEGRAEELQDYTDILQWGSKCRQALSELREDGFEFSEQLHIPSALGVPSSEQVPSLLVPDFEVTKEDIHLFVFLDVRSERGSIPVSTLRQYQRSLVKSAYTSAVVHVWRGEDLPSIALNMFRLTKIDMSGKMLQFEPIKSLKEVIREYYQTSFVGDWSLDDLQSVKAQRRPVNSYALVEREFRAEIRELKRRAVRRWHRKEAQDLIDEELAEAVLSLIRGGLGTGQREDIGKRIPSLVEQKATK